MRLFCSWDWSGDWIIDTSKSFGETDAEGWVYGTSFEKILEMIASNTTTGICSSTSIFRRRCWRRKMVCTSEEIATSVEKRRTRLTASRQAVVEILTEKQSKVDSVKKYEAQRIVAHKKAYITSTHTVKYVETSVKEHSTKLKILRQVVNNFRFDYLMGFIFVDVCSLFVIEWLWRKIMLENWIY